MRETQKRQHGRPYLLSLGPAELRPKTCEDEAQKSPSSEQPHNFAPELHPPIFNGFSQTFPTLRVNRKK